MFKSNQEASIRALFEEAFRASHRQGSCYNPGLQQFVPEPSAVGESQSNGKAENAAQRLEDMIRTYKSALEDRIRFRVPSGHPLLRWIVDHATSVYNRHACNDDGATPYEVMHGQRYVEKTPRVWRNHLLLCPKALAVKVGFPISHCRVPGLLLEFQ